VKRGEERAAADQVLAALRAERKRKSRAQGEIDAADAAIADLLKTVPKMKGITMEEAAEQAGISRNMAYKLIRKRPAV
jgi:DNA-binding phage protein